MLPVRLAGDHQYGKLLFIWLSLVMSLMVPFVLYFSNGMSWMRSWTELSQFLTIFLPSFDIDATLILSNRHPAKVLSTTVSNSISSGGNRSMTSFVYEHGKQCMPCSHRIISEIPPKIYTMERCYFLKPIYLFSSDIIVRFTCDGQLESAFRAHVLVHINY